MGIETDIPSWLRETVPTAHYPRRPTEEELNSNANANVVVNSVAPPPASLSADQDLFPKLDMLYVVLVDMPGMLRINVELTPVFQRPDGSGYTFGRYVPRSERTWHSEDGGFFQEDNASITNWGEYMERVLMPITNALARPSVAGAVIIIDGPAPRAKELHYQDTRYKYKLARARQTTIVRDTRPGAPPRFSAQSPIYNKVDDILMDPEAKREFQEFFGSYVFTTYANSDALPVGKCLVMHGGRYEGRVLSHPLMAVRSTPQVVSITQYDGRLGANPRAPMFFVSSEADISINSWLNHLPVDRDIAVQSKDGDVELLLLSRLQDRVRVHGDLARLGKLWLRRARTVGQEDATAESTPLFAMPDPLLDAAGEEIPEEDLGVDDEEADTTTATTVTTYDSTSVATEADEDEETDVGSVYAPSALSSSSSAAVTEGDTEDGPAKPPTKKRRAPAASKQQAGPKKPRRRPILQIEWIDMNFLYTRLFLLFDGLHQTLPAHQRSHPIETFLLLAFIRKNDYMERLPGLTFKPLMAYYLEEGYKRGKLLVSTQMRTRRGCEQFDDLHRVRLHQIHYLHLEQFLLGAYRRKFHLDTEKKWLEKMKRKISDDAKRELMDGRTHYKWCPTPIVRKEKMVEVKKLVDQRVKELPAFDDVVAEFNSLARLRQWLAAHERGMAAQHPPENLRVTAANLAWVLNYYTQGGKADFVLMNEFAVDEKTRVSLHGYCLTPNNEVLRAKEVVQKAIY